MIESVVDLAHWKHFNLGLNLVAIGKIEHLLDGGWAADR